MSQEQPTSSQEIEQLIQQHEEPVSEVEVAVVHLLDLAVVTTDEQVECKLCGLHDDDHAIGCPIPVLEEWINPTSN